MSCDDIIANMHYVCTTFRARKSSLFQRARSKNYKTREYYGLSSHSEDVKLWYDGYKLVGKDIYPEFYS